MNAVEEGLALQLDFGKLERIGRSGAAVLPVVLQNADSQEVLFVGYANQLALTRTLETKTAVLWSTSRDELWYKGETSGDVLDVIDVRVNCEQNSLLYRVRPRSGVCHTRGPDGDTRATCYYRGVASDGRSLRLLEPQS